MRPSVLLIHWKPAEAQSCLDSLASAGYDAQFFEIHSMDFLRQLREAPPSAVVIDLSRLPSQGRDIGVAIRAQKSTRRLPLVFAGGLPEKVARVRQVLPDAVFAQWDGIVAALQQAIHHPPAEPVSPQSIFGVYQDTPLVKKLGIKPGMTVGLLGAPAGFPQTLGDLPEGVVLQEGLTPHSPGVVIWFVDRLGELLSGIENVLGQMPDVPLWIAWPKKSASPEADLTQLDVRAAGLHRGWVDFKICAIDARWSALCFRKRKIPVKK